MAEAEGETLASSNLAIRLLEAGFAPEATQLLETAQAVPDHSKNVDSTMSRVKSVDEDEAEKEKSTLSSAGAVSVFYRQFGSAATKMMPNLVGTWKGRECPLVILHKGDSFSASGHFPEPTGLLGLAIAKPKDGAGDSAQPLLKVEFQGKVHGRAVTVTRRVRRAREAAQTILGDSDSAAVLMWLSNDGTTLTCMERTGTAPPIFYNIVRQA